MAPKKVLGPLTDDEAQARMNKLVGIITSEAQKEINQISAQSSEDVDEMKKGLVAEPKQIIDEWVEKLRAFTERQTKIHCARLRRIAKLRILEAYGDIRESIKNEAREHIKRKMSKKTQESDKILREMLFQGLLRLMESKVLVHTTKADLERVSKQYDSVKKRYKDMTGNDLLIISSRHPLKDHYYGRIVISDKLSSLFVDINLFVSVDKVADEVFAHYAAYQDKAGTSKNWGMEALRQRGLHIMPRGANISPQQLDTIISTLRGDPRTQAPVFQIREDTKKQGETDSGEGKDTDGHQPRGSASSGHHKQQRASSNADKFGKMRKVTIAPENMAGMRPSLSLMEPGGYSPSKYNYRETNENTDHIVGNSNDLYNLDFTSNTDILSQSPSRAATGTMGALSLGSELDSPTDNKKSVSADKESPRGPAKAQKHQTLRSVSESVDSEVGSRFSADSGFSGMTSDGRVSAGHPAPPENPKGTSSNRSSSQPRRN